MIAISCDWNADLSLGPSGDISVVRVHACAQQRIIRRLLTNPGDYIWHVDYGAGLGSYVGDPYPRSSIKSLVLNQLTLESLVMMTPSIKIQTNQSSSDPPSTISITVQYQVVGAPTANSVVLELGTK